MDSHSERLIQEHSRHKEEAYSATEDLPDNQTAAFQTKSQHRVKTKVIYLAIVSQHSQLLVHQVFLVNQEFQKVPVYSAINQMTKSLKDHYLGEEEILI